jgi:hypothetical protein
MPTDDLIARADYMADVRHVATPNEWHQMIADLAAEVRALTAERDALVIDHGYIGRLEVAERALTARLDAAKAVVDEIRETPPDYRFALLPDLYAVLDRAATADPTPKCFCPGGGEPEGLNHRPGCPLASETKT